MIPLDNMADLPEKQKQKLLESMETMQAKDKYVVECASQPCYCVHQK
jgi:hypothetical protein